MLFSEHIFLNLDNVINVLIIMIRTLPFVCYHFPNLFSAILFYDDDECAESISFRLLVKPEFDFKLKSYFVVSFFFLKMNSLVNRSSFSSSCLRIIAQAIAVVPDLQISNKKIPLNGRTISSKVIEEKFQLPQRYQGSKPSVW